MYFRPVIAKVMKQKYLSSLLIFVLIFSNFWIFWIFEFNFIIGEIITVLTLLLFVNTFSKSTIINLVIFLLLAFAGLFLLMNYLNHNLLTTSEIGKIRIEQRRNYYSQELGKLYGNKVGIFYFDKLKPDISKIQTEFFSSLDWNIYFSPKQLLSYEKFPLIFSPFFIAGLLYFIYKSNKVITTYFIISLLITTFITLDSMIRYSLLFPFIMVCVGRGIILLNQKVKTFFRIYHI